MIPYWIATALVIAEKTSTAVQKVAQEPVSQTPQGAINDTLLAIFLLLIAVVLLLLEFLIVSYGLLAISALGFAIAGIAFGFSASPIVGWVLLGLTPILTFAVVSWGFNRLQRSQLVPKAEITDDAGYRHKAELMGIAIGSHGVLVTDAIPTGRARFDNGEIDVCIEGPSALRDSKITITRIEGPTVFAVVNSGPQA